MRLFTIFLLCVLSALGQTRVRSNQGIRDIFPNEGESSRCPGPILDVQSPTLMVIGKNWSETNPCYVHMSVVVRVDPIHVERFTQPATLSIIPDSPDDDVYIWWSIPVVSPPTPSKLFVGAKNPAQINCPSCTIQAQTGTRMFPANVVPIGVIFIRNGVIAPGVVTILDHHQISVNTPMTIRVIDGLYQFEVGTQTLALAQQQQQMEMSKLQLAKAQVDATTRMLNATPPPIKRLEAMEKRYDGQYQSMQAMYNELRYKIPPNREDIAKFMEEMNNTRMSFQQLQMEAYRGGGMERERMWDMQNQLRQEVSMRLMQIYQPVPAPKSPEDPCMVGQFAYDNTYKYECVVDGARHPQMNSMPSPMYNQPGTWRRYKVENTWFIPVTDAKK